MVRASRVRGRVLTFAFLLAVITYLDRICISAAAPFIMQDLHLSVLQMSVVFSAFTLAYSLFEIPSGWLGDVPSSFARAIRMAAGENHPHGAEHVRDRAQQPHLEVGASRLGLDDLGQPETHSVQRHRNREVHDREQPHSHAFQRGGGRARLSRACHGVLGQLSEKRFPLCAGEPRGVFWPFGKKSQDREPEDNRGQSLEEEQPLPSGQARHAVQRQQGA